MSYYDEHEPTMNVDVLGVTYKVYVGVKPEDDTQLDKCDGYCDSTIARIVTVGRVAESDFGDWGHYEKQILRHELIHAFLHESGIDGNFKWDGDTEHPEGLVAWLSIQFPKLLKTFVEVDAL